MMNLRLLILFLGICSTHCTLVTAASNVFYEKWRVTLKNVIAPNVTKVSLSNIDIEKLHINSLNAIEEVVSLDLSYNRISTFPRKIFSNLSNLRELLLVNNQFSSFNCTDFGLTNLEYLDLSGNWIKTLYRGDLFGLTKTGKVILSDWLKEISSGIFKDPSVPVLIENEETPSNGDSGISHPHYSGNFTICISVDGILESINMDKNDFKGICTSQSQKNQSHRDSNINYEALIFLKMLNDNITDVKNDAFGKLNLDHLNLGENRLRSTGFAKTLPSTIRILKLYENPISEVPLDSFYGLKNLIELEMQEMEVTNIEPGTFRDQANLLKLRLDYNKISVLKPGLFQGLKSLKEIYLSDNQITKIPSNLFEGYNQSPRFSFFLYYNSIKIIEKGAFSGMNLQELQLAWNPLGNNSIQEGAFNGSVISKMTMISRKLLRFDGEWFNGISGLKDITLGSSSVKKIEKGFAEHMKDVMRLYLGIIRVPVLQNGALFGLSTEKEVKISLYVNRLTIEGGLFDDL